MNQAVLDLEQLRDIPGPRLRGTGGHLPAARRREVTRLAGRGIEEHESEDEPALGIDGDEAPIADARYEVQQSRLELLAAAPLRRIVRGRRGIRPRFAGRGGPVRRLHAV